MMSTTITVPGSSSAIFQYCELHKKLIERMLRDQIIHDVNLAYKIGEMKLRSETVVHKTN